MAKLKIKNFGPIKNGYSQNDGYLEITPVTVICGNQATGKSTIAKLFSIFSWLEKANVKSGLGKINENIDDFKSLCKPHHIDEYFSDDTEIHFIGTTCEFKYEKGKFIPSTTNIDDKLLDYKRPKVMYIPAERNLITAIENAEDIKNLPAMLSILLDEYDKAKRSSKTGEFKLPISNVRLQYDKQTRSMNVITNNQETISLTAASSGIQSVTPISVVTQYLSDEVSSDFLNNVQKLSINERNQIKEWLRDNSDNEAYAELFISQFEQLIYGKKIEPSISEKIEKLLHYFFNTCLINIVEEPEQNLYPQSQSNVLYELLECNNKLKNNQLLITTHSPYILSYLTLSAKAAELLSKGVPEEEISKILPVDSAIAGEKISIYETKADGSIQLLEPYENLPSDENELNVLLNDSNETFSKLLELEDEFCK